MLVSWDQTPHDPVLVAGAFQEIIDSVNSGKCHFGWSFITKKGNGLIRKSGLKLNLSICLNRIYAYGVRETGTIRAPVNRCAVLPVQCLTEYSYLFQLISNSLALYKKNLSNFDMVELNVCLPGFKMKIHQDGSPIEEFHSIILSELGTITGTCVNFYSSKKNSFPVLSLYGKTTSYNISSIMDRFGAGELYHERNEWDGFGCVIVVRKFNCLAIKKEDFEGAMLYDAIGKGMEIDQQDLLKKYGKIRDLQHLSIHPLVNRKNLIRPIFPVVPNKWFGLCSGCSLKLIASCISRDLLPPLSKIEGCKSKAVLVFLNWLQHSNQRAASWHTQGDLIVSLCLSFVIHKEITNMPTKKDLRLIREEDLVNYCIWENSLKSSLISIIAWKKKLKKKENFQDVPFPVFRQLKNGFQFMGNLRAKMCVEVRNSDVLYFKLI